MQTVKKCIMTNLLLNNHSLAFIKNLSLYYLSANVQNMRMKHYHFSIQSNVFSLLR